MSETNEEKLKKRVEELEAKETIKEEVEKQIDKKLKPYKPRANLGGYDTKAGDDMSGHGWVQDSITFKYLSIKENGKIICSEVDFYRKDLTHDCQSNRYLWFVPARTGIFLACTWCKTAETLSRERGIKRKEYEISVDEAIEIMLSRGYKIGDMPMRRFLNLKKKRSPKLAEKRERPKVSK